MRRRAICLIASAAAFVVFLDATIVNVAFSSIQRSFAPVSRAELALTLAAYAASLGALLLPAGHIGDHVGHRRLFLGSFAAFVGASALCGVAISAPMLIAARTLQGAAAGCMAPSSLALMLPLFRSDEQTYAVGIWSAGAGLAALLGPALGGVAVEALGWRSIFLVNVPIGALAVAAGAWLLPVDEPAVARAAAWRSVAAVRRLLANGSLRRANLATLLTSAAGFALMFGNMLFLTSVWRYSALELGLAVSPGPVMTALTAIPAGRLADRFGVLPVAVPGALLLAAGAGWFALETSAHPAWAATWLPGSLMTGVGIGLSFPPIAASALAPAGREAIGAAVGINGVVRQLGAVAGVALVVALVRDAPPASAPAILHRSWALVAVLALAGAAVTLRSRSHASPAAVPARERRNSSRQR